MKIFPLKCNGFVSVSLHGLFLQFSILFMSQQKTSRRQNTLFCFISNPKPFAWFPLSSLLSALLFRDCSSRGPSKLCSLPAMIYQQLLTPFRYREYMENILMGGKRGEGHNKNTQRLWKIFKSKARQKKLYIS